jgi:hypothetical protein
MVEDRLAHGVAHIAATGRVLSWASAARFEGDEPVFVEVTWRDRQLSDQPTGRQGCSARFTGYGVLLRVNVCKARLRVRYVSLEGVRPLRVRVVRLAPRNAEAARLGITLRVPRETDLG